MDKDMQLSPDILRTFVAAARTLNFTHAARKVHLTQSAVSMQMNRLESDLGKILFRRITRGVELTADGERLLEYSRRILRLHDEAVASLSQPELDGLIRLGAAEDYASQHLPGILRRFGKRYPLVRVDLYCDLSDNLLGMLQRGELDLCLCNSENGEHGGDFLRNEPVVWIAPMDSEVEKESPLPLAVFHRGCMFRKWAMQTLADQGISYRVAYSSPSIAGVLAAVKAGLAVAPVGASIPASGFRILADGVLNPLPSAVVSLHQSNRRVSRAQTYLAHHIAAEFRSMPFSVSRPHLVKQA
jgi:DNA-binding transcriptional LysR family regulator